MRTLWGVSFGFQSAFALCTASFLWGNPRVDALTFYTAVIFAIFSGGAMLAVRTKP